MSSVGYSATATPAARLIAVVVFPTPPFWFAIVTTLGIDAQSGSEKQGDDSEHDIHPPELVEAVAVKLGFLVEPAVRRGGIEILEHPRISDRIKDHKHEQELLQSENDRPAVAELEHRKSPFVQHHDE